MFLTEVLNFTCSRENCDLHVALSASFFLNVQFWQFLNIGMHDNPF